MFDRRGNGVFLQNVFNLNKLIYLCARNQLRQLMYKYVLQALILMIFINLWTFWNIAG